MQRASYIGLILLVIISILSGILTAYLIYDYSVQRDKLQKEAVANAEAQASVAAQDINVAFSEVMTIADALADDLSNGTLQYNDIEAHLFALVERRPDIDGVAITFEPFQYDPDLRLFQTYVYKTEDDSFDALVGATYDYTARNTDIDTSWYTNVIDDGAGWHEPFFASGARKVLIEYGVPFYAVNATDDAPPTGIVTIDYTLETMHDLVRQLQLGGTGYGFVLSDTGTFLAHPVSDFVVNQSLLDLSDDETLIQAVENAQQGNRNFVEIIDPITQETTWYFFEPIDSTEWTIGIVLNAAQFLPDALQTIRDQMVIALSIAVTFFLVLATIFHVDNYKITDFWAASVIFSSICVLLIVIVWFLTNQLSTHHGIGITDESQLERFLQGINSPLGTTSPPQNIPTGVLVQALQFPDPTSVTVNGYLWQRYPVDYDEPFGFSLPQRIGEEATIEEVQRETSDDETLIVWYIGVTLRQTYDTVRFPFDHRNITIRVAPNQPNANIILTPDLNAYDLITPSVLPGVDANVSINNWTLLSSRFSYTDSSARVNVTLSDDTTAIRHPELNFNIEAQRVYLGAFIAYLLPGLVAAALTFAYLISGREAGRNDEIISALNYSAALFFVVAVIHSALRSQIAAVGITYLEYIYILLYLAIISVVFNMFLMARFPDWLIIRYRNNLTFKVLYWPIFAGIMLIATLLIFIY